MAAGDIEIYDPEMDRWWPLMLVNEWDQKAESIRARVVVEQMFAAEAGSDIENRLLPDVQEDWLRGSGLDYNWAPGLYTRSPGYVCPAGHPVVVPLPTPDAGQIVAHAEVTVGGSTDLFLAQIGYDPGGFGRVIRIPNGDGTPVDSLVLGANEYMRGLCVADMGNGENAFLYAFSSDGGVQHGRIHRWTGSIWESTPAYPDASSFGVNGRGPAGKVFWTTGDGVGASRIVTISGLRMVSYTKPFGDPMDPDDWVEAVRITGSRGQLRRVVCAKTHAFLTAEDGLFDLQEDGSSPNLLGYIEGMVEPGNGYAAEYLDGSVFYALATGVDKVIVEQSGLLQEAPGFCAPGWGTRVEHPAVGRTVAMATDQGYLVNAVTNQSNRHSYIWWGKSRAALQIDSPNPMIWYGPEVVVLNKSISEMSVSGVVAGQRRLWVSCHDDDGISSLFRVSLPLAGAPLQDLFAGGNHKYNRGLGDTGDYQPYARLFPLSNTYQDKPSLKIVHEHAVGTRGLSERLDGSDDGLGTKLIEYDRADPDPGSEEWGAAAEITKGPAQTIQPPDMVKGYEIERRLDFISPAGTASPPKAAYLNSLRTTVWKVAPSFMVRAVTVAYGAGVLDRALGRGSGGTSVSPSDVAARIEAIIRYGPTRMRDALRPSRIKRIRLAQNYKAGRTWLEGSSREAIEMQLAITIIGDEAEAAA